MKIYLQFENGRPKTWKSTYVQFEKLKTKNMNMNMQFEKLKTKYMNMNMQPKKNDIQFKNKHEHEDMKNKKHWIKNSNTQFEK